MLRVRFVYPPLSIFSKGMDRGHRVWRYSGGVGETNWSYYLDVAIDDWAAHSSACSSRTFPQNRSEPTMIFISIDPKRSVTFVQRFVDSGHRQARLGIRMTALLNCGEGAGYVCSRHRVSLLGAAHSNDYPVSLVTFARYRSDFSKLMLPCGRSSELEGSSEINSDKRFQ